MEMLTNIPPGNTNLETESQYMILNKSNEVHLVQMHIDHMFRSMNRNVKQKKKLLIENTWKIGDW